MAPPPRPPDVRRVSRAGSAGRRCDPSPVRLGERCHRPAVVTRRGGSGCHDGVRRVKRCRVPPLRSGRSGDSPAAVADGGWLLTDAGVRLVNETGIDGSTAPTAPIVASGIAGAVARKPFPAGTHQPGATRPGRCDGGTPVGPENRRFRWVAPGFSLPQSMVPSMARTGSVWSMESMAYGRFHVTGGVTAGVTGPVTESQPSSHSPARHKAAVELPR